MANLFVLSFVYIAYRQLRHVGGTVLESEMVVIQDLILSCEYHHQSGDCQANILLGRIDILVPLPCYSTSSVSLHATI
jgi:hypothetical protein